jgi:hypothetical protein
MAKYPYDPLSKPATSAISNFIGGPYRWIVHNDLATVLRRAAHPFLARTLRTTFLILEVSKSEEPTHRQI